MKFLVEFKWLCVVSVGCLLASSGSAESDSAAVKSVQPISTWQGIKVPGSFITALAYDTEGNIWVGTEGHGVFRYAPGSRKATQWIQFTATNGLGDDCVYSIVCDKLGRIWVGHLNHGVSVFNGATWTNYDVLQGPIGERVFKIACCPKNGDVWIATSAGLTRYSEQGGLWRHYTRANGLPSEQVSALAFDKDGNVYIGTQCDGIAKAKADENYRNWQIYPVRDEPRVVYSGFGISTPQINDLLVSSDGYVFAATSSGLVFSKDDGNTWVFKRGVDYASKLRGVTNIPPRSFKKESLPKDLMPEDYATCLAEDSTGLLWVGFRRQGFIAIAPYCWRQIFSGTPKQTGGADYIKAILPTADSTVFLGRYGGGLAESPAIFKRGSLTTRSLLPDAPDAPRAEPLINLPESAGKVDYAKLALNGPLELSPTDDSSALTDLHANLEIPLPELHTSAADLPSVPTAPFPVAASVPSLKELNAILAELRNVPEADSNQPIVVALEDDWRTEGQWLGRYGRFWSVLCADRSPKDDVWGAGWGVTYGALVGMNHAAGDSLRYWVHWLATSDNRCLEMTPIYMHSRVVKNLTTWEKDRRESEWDDHGETYPMTMNGPHVYCSVSIPGGLFYLSLYDVNPNGHENANRFRDYYISIKSGETKTKEVVPGKTVRPLIDFAGWDKNPEFAHARITEFWGGVYKRFLVQGPAKLTVQINRNYSFNTILAGVMLDLTHELPPPYFQSRQEWEQRETRKQTLAKQLPELLKPAVSEEQAVSFILQGLQHMPTRNAVWWAMNRRRFFLPLAQWYLTRPNSERYRGALARCYYQLGLYSQWEGKLKEDGCRTARDIEKSLRWDGVLESSVAKGHQIITNYLAENPQ